MAEAKKDDRSFNQRLMDAMAEMVNPTKGNKAKIPTKSGGTIQYNYESLDQVLEIVIPALRNHGLAMTQRQSFIGDSWVLETLVFDDKESQVMDTRLLPLQTDAQRAGSYETYMRRYALKTVFGLAGEDDDGAATVQAKNQNPASNRKKTGNNNILDGAKITEMASKATMSKIESHLIKLAELKGMTPEQVKDFLMKSKTMKDAGKYDAMTEEEANNALCLLIQWEGQANEYASEDIDF